MEQFSPLNFLLISVPEEILMAFLAWIILGKRDKIKIRFVLMAGIITAFSFALTKFLIPDDNSASMVQVIEFALIIYLIYKLNLIETLVGSLLTSIILVLVQATVLNIGLMITAYTMQDVEKNTLTKFIFFIPSFLTFAVIITIIYKFNIKVFNFKQRKVSSYYFNRVRFIVLQMAFTFFIMLFNFRLYFSNKNLFIKSTDKILIIINLILIIIFTVLIVRSAFIIGKSIQQEEELKRQFDGREIIQNIDYICSLIKENKLDEANNMLQFIKDDINLGIIKDSSYNRENPIK